MPLGGSDIVTKVRIVESPESLAGLEAQINASAKAAAKALSESLGRDAPLEVLRRMKYQTVGTDPLEERPLNLVEQINQTFTYLATFQGVRYLFRKHPDRAPFIINLGTAAGPDIRSRDGSVVAEVFAAVSPRSNRKLSKDLKKLSVLSAEHKYVFYSCPGEPQGEIASAKSHPDIQIVSIGVC